MEGNSFKYNNFDLIRLIAALQVLIVHYSNYFNLSNYFSEFLMYLPGVPIFFFLSGYLITASWDRLKKEKIITYTTNRCLRIFPALVVCVLIGFLSVLASGYEFNTGSWAAVPLWLLSQITFLQFYNPSFMDQYGTGIFNGSLWTISIEIQFYIMAPFLVILAQKLKKITICLFIVFILLNLFNIFENERQTFQEKLFNLSALPWAYMFMTGMYFAISPNLKNFVLKRTFLFLEYAFYNNSFLTLCFRSSV